MIKELIKLSFLFITLIAIMNFAGCEQIDIIETNLPYHEKIVVRGVLEENKAIDGISFTRTLPLNETYSIQRAELKDVVAYLKIGVKIIPLKYDRNGIYKPITSIVPIKGMVYELYGKYDTKNIYAKTYVPTNPKIRNAYKILDASGHYLKAEIQNQPGTVFGAKWIVMENGTVLYESDGLYSISEPTDDPNKTIQVRTPNIPKEIMNTFKNNISIRVYAFDKQYQEYFKTKNSSLPIKDSFVQSGGEVNWNIQGDGIGLFIGYSLTTLKVN